MADVEAARARVGRRLQAIGELIRGADQAERVGEEERLLVGHPLRGGVRGDVPVLGVRHVRVDAADHLGRVDVDAEAVEEGLSSGLCGRDDVGLDDPGRLARIGGDVRVRPEADVEVLDAASLARRAFADARERRANEVGMPGR